MSIDRRKFLSLAGLGALTLVGKKALGDDSLTFQPKGELPDGEPIEGKRWAMVIDLNKCRNQPDCNICTTACHKIHNVPQFDNPKDEVKWIWKEPFDKSFPSQENHYGKEDILHHPAIILCNHCDSPPCVKVCPTQATWKREDGIVMMDMHRCIGCRYCMAACPYGSRSFNWRDPRPAIKEIDKDFPTRSRGVVEKCNFCAERLAKGKIPICSEVCPEKALIFGDLEDADSPLRQILKENFTIRRKPLLGTNPEIYYIV